MKLPLSVLKYLFLAASLVSAWSCGSGNQGENSANVHPNNGNSNAASPAVKRLPKENTNDPKAVCAWLSEFPAGEYKLYFGNTYTCKTEKAEELGAGKRLHWTYEPFGTTGNVEYVELSLASNNKPDVNQKAETRFVSLAEALWQKSYAAPLPSNIKNEMLATKGKPTMSAKNFDDEVINTVVMHSEAGNGIYGLKFRFYLKQ